MLEKPIITKYKYILFVSLIFSPEKLLTLSCDITDHINDIPNSDHESYEIYIHTYIQNLHDRQSNQIMSTFSLMPIYCQTLQHLIVWQKKAIQRNNTLAKK